MRSLLRSLAVLIVIMTLFAGCACPRAIDDRTPSQMTARERFWLSHCSSQLAP